MSRISRLAMFALVAIILLPTLGCGAAIGHMIARDAAEDITAQKYACTVPVAEQAVLDAYKTLRIEFVERKNGDNDVIIVGRDPEDVGVETTVRPLNNGVVKITCSAGSFFGTMINGSKADRVQQEVTSTIAHKLHANGSSRLGAGG